MLLALNNWAKQTKTDIFANSVDPEEMAHNEPMAILHLMTEMPIYKSGLVQI